MALIGLVVMFAILAILADMTAKAAMREIALLRTELRDLQRRVASAPGRVAELERDLGMDLTDLPGPVAAAIRTMRAVRRG